MTTMRLRGLFRNAVVALPLLIISQFSHAQTYAIVYSFIGETDGAKPNGDLIQDAAGNLYGTTFQGGAHDLGVVFKLDPSGVETILHNFTGAADGSHPEAGLIQDQAGNLYGMTTDGGSEGLGTVFELDTNNVVTSLHSFKGGTDGAEPISRLVSINGDLYGVTPFGGIVSSDCGGSCGTIFKVTKGGKETVLYRFTGGSDGVHPQSIIRDSAGNLYGVTSESGTVFKLDSAGAFTVLYTFDGVKLAFPVGRLTIDTNGNIHGVTQSGAVYRLDTSGRLTVLHLFSRGEGGYDPLAGLLDAGGTLYGTTRYGGDPACNSPGYSCGVLYQISKTGEYIVVHRFAGTDMGDSEDSQVGGETLGSDGSIYGATWHGGTGACIPESFPGCGVIFKYTP